MAFLEEYTLLSELGKGGFATVYKVRHNELGYIRAIRVLNDIIKDKNEKAYKNFLRESNLLMRIGCHPNIVHMYQSRILDNMAIMEMEYIAGADLLRVLSANGYCLPVREVIRMVYEISSALAYCHEDIYKFRMDRDADGLRPDPMDGSKLLIDDATRLRLIDKYKVIHNDIHSRNIMRRDNGGYVLIDFILTVEGNEVVIGSDRICAGAIEYISPEKWDSESLTERSDIYSFGVVMYEYLTGRVPFKMDNGSLSEQTKLLEKVMGQQVPSIFEMRKASYEAKYPDKSYRKDYPDWLEKAILKCLEKDPAKRFRNGKELYNFVVNNLKWQEINDFDDIVDQLSFENSTRISSLKRNSDEINVNITSVNNSGNELKSIPVKPITVIIKSGNSCIS